ncbi:hypothetical protein OPKNFCMD_4020 [Methylobacterium crusticola]|uniref:Crp/Fnr family transcriptional regulator n=1 Tax=Methylobacterium crusticola TaxID=1697972 RepID=A0ABQ4R0R3_9HYPH|nr:winged helix-turn-helix domain-containing protein [Methylobacterium crusticola]GJD51267.1 hypothetical protein OPKNFCMD_4020 [Methylobacterium crusticola]
MLIKAHAPLPRVAIIEDGTLSGAAPAADGGPIALALVGREGMVGTPVLLGTRMLGVNRPGLTAGVSVLARFGMIRRQRGIITIRDRAALLVAAGASYGTPEGECARLAAGSAEGGA